MLFRAYIDDSADKRQKTVMVAGALVATHREWTDFSVEWKKQLRVAGLKYFRSTEYYSLTGEFARFRDRSKYPPPLGRRAATALRSRLETLLNPNRMRGLVSIVPVQTYLTFRSSVPGAVERLPDDVYSAALLSMFLECACMVRERIPGQHRLAFVCDDSPKAPIYSQVYSTFKEKNPGVAGIMEGMVHVDDKKHPPLQAADMIASMGREAAFSLLQDPPELELKRMKDGSRRTMAKREYTPPRFRDLMQNMHFWNWQFLEAVMNNTPSLQRCET